MNFLTVFLSVLFLLLYAVPGFILVKSKLIHEKNIKALSTILMYVCQPFLCITSFQNIERTNQNTIDMLIALACVVSTYILVIGVLFLIYHKKFDDIRYRVATITSAFGNVAFMGIPLIKDIMPYYANGPMICTIYLSVMTITGWTIGCGIITRDKSYISLKKVFLNPGIIALFISLILYAFDLRFINIPIVGTGLDNLVDVLGNLSTPLCMIILGSRLATIKFKELVNDHLTFVNIAIKQVITPLLVFLVLSFIPMEANLKTAIVIISATPIAQIAQNFTEVINQGQKQAATSCLLGTILSLITMPCICLLLK